IWYRKWLLVHLLNLWSVPPCINWCYYVQLACPHLATSKVVDYAGHPSFQCRDLNIPSVNVPGDPGRMKLTTVSSSSASKGKATIASQCACLHPCDLEEFYSLIDTTCTTEESRPSSYSNTVHVMDDEEDFFPSMQHCMIRRHLCDSMKNDVGEHRVIRRRVTTADDISTVEGKKLRKLNDDISFLNYLTSMVSIFMRSLALPHREDSAIEESFTGPLGYISQWWWTKHRVRRRSQFNAKIFATTTVTPNTIVSTTAVTPLATTTTTTTTTTAATTATMNSAVNLKGMKWSICSGIFIYTLYILFFPLLLLRRPPCTIIGD
ncbi:unnamed protein product, partial [Litomosoides sigmodontis]